MQTYKPRHVHLRLGGQAIPISPHDQHAIAMAQAFNKRPKEPKPDVPTFEQWERSEARKGRR